MSGGSEAMRPAELLPKRGGVPRVDLDVRMARHGGIGRYVTRLVTGLRALPDAVRLRTWGLREGDHASGAIGIPDVVYDAPIYSLREQITGSRLARAVARRPDSVVHIPHYNAPWLLPRRSVVTVHDTIHFDLPELFSPWKRRVASLVLARGVARAGRIIAVSEATRRDLERRVAAARGKVDVVPHGVGAPFGPDGSESTRQFRDRKRIGAYAVYVGNAKPHKNLHRLLEAHASLVAVDPGFELVLIGTGPEVAVGRPGVRALGRIDDEELANWYRAARVCVMPSLLEGFGLPVLEAMACGCPVVAAGIPALQETAGDAALFADPEDSMALSASIRRLLEEPETCAALRARGLARVASRTWEGSTRATVDVYRRAMGAG